jgi:transposase
MSKGFWTPSCTELSTALAIPPDRIEWDEQQHFKSTKLNVMDVPDIKIPVHVKSTPGESLMYTRKIKLKLNLEQKKKFKLCFDAHTYFYNKAVVEINRLYDRQKDIFQNNRTCNIDKCRNPKTTDNKCEYHKLNYSKDDTYIKNERCSVVGCGQNKMLLYVCEDHIFMPLKWPTISHISLRNLVGTKDENVSKSKRPDFLKVQADTRNMAVKSACTALKACISNKKAGNIKHFRLKEIAYGNSTRIFWVSGKAFKVDGKIIKLFPRELKDHSVLRFSRKYEKFIPEKEDGKADTFRDSVILFDRGAYYLCVVDEFEKEDNIAKQNSIISLDPGVRTFQTGYSPDGQIYKFGDNFQTNDLTNRIDELNSLINGVNHKTRRNMNKRLAILRRKLRDRISNLHNQTISFLTNNFKNILLPDFGTSSMLSGGGLFKTINRKMQNLSFYQFKQKLIHLGHRRGSNVYIVNESHTTMTCGKCGQQKTKDEMKQVNTVYNCSCGYSSDRDVHGARNILIKTINLSK